MKSINNRLIKNRRRQPFAGAINGRPCVAVLPEPSAGGEKRSEGMRELMDRLGYHFKDESLLRMALTHPSMGRKDNQRLEFLGDAVLQLLMSELLYHKHPELREGGLTHQRALLVCEAALHQVALSLGLGQYLIMDKGENKTHGRNKPSILADAAEAVLAAVYLDGGLEAARNVMTAHWPKEGESPLKDSKGLLQEYLQARGSEPPYYELTGQEGPPHDRVFTVQALVEGRPVAQGRGKSKKQAEQRAAEKAYEILTGKGAAAGAGGKACG